MKSSRIRESRYFGGICASIYAIVLARNLSNGVVQYTQGSRSTLLTTGIRNILDIRSPHLRGERQGIVVQPLFVTVPVGVYSYFSA
jgi:hypothetical protein